MNMVLTIALGFLVLVVGYGLSLIINDRLKENINFLTIAVALVIPIAGAWLFLSIYSFSVSTDIEWWGSYITHVRYYEAWNERVSCKDEIPCTHDRTCKDANGKTYSCGKVHSNDGYQHPYDVEEHPPRYIGYNAIGETFNYDGDYKFNQLCGTWKTKQRVELNRSYHTKDGDMYQCNYSGRNTELEATTTEHFYENKIPVSISYLRTSPPTEEETEEEL